MELGGITEGCRRGVLSPHYPTFTPGSPALGSPHTSPSNKFPPPVYQSSKSEQLPLTCSVTSGKSLLFTGDPKNQPSRAVVRINEDEGCAALHFRAGLCMWKACFYLLSLSEPSCAPGSGEEREGLQQRHKLANPALRHACLTQSANIFLKELTSKI